METVRGSVAVRSEHRSITEQVLQAVADEEGTSPMELDAPLYDVIDPDALEALFADDRTPESVQFSYLGYRVTIDGDRQIDVTGDGRDALEDSASDTTV